jgi:hypothetical protein
VSDFFFNSYGLLETEDEYLMALASSKFVFCPPGMGWDSYRIWETIMLGSIPGGSTVPGVGSAVQ